MTISRPLRRACAVTILGVIAGCGGRTQPAAGETAPAPYEPVSARPATPPPADSSAAALPAWVTVDSAGRAVMLALEVTSPPSSPSALINGYRSGGVRVTVPLGWTVKWDWRSADSADPHSLVVMVQREKIPLEGGRAAFSNARTRMVTEGLPAGQTDQSTFVAEEAGWYWMLCGVPGHALKGEWVELRVDPDAKLPSVKTRPPAAG